MPLSTVISVASASHAHRQSLSLLKKKRPIFSLTGSYSVATAITATQIDLQHKRKISSNFTTTSSTCECHDYQRRYYRSNRGNSSDNNNITSISRYYNRNSYHYNREDMLASFSTASLHNYVHNNDDNENTNKNSRLYPNNQQKRTLRNKASLLDLELGEGSKWDLEDNYDVYNDDHFNDHDDNLLNNDYNDNQGQGPNIKRMIYQNGNPPVSTYDRDVSLNSNIDSHKISNSTKTSEMP